MKQIPTLLLLGFALTLCNLTNKFKSGGETGGSGGSSKVEKAEPTAAQTAALAGGQTATWAKQGMSWTVPPKWTPVSEEKNTFSWSSPGGFEGAHLNVNVSVMSDDFPAEASLKAEYESSLQRMKHGELDQVRWLEIDGVRGVQFRESNPDKPDGFRRTQWIAFRKFAGELQQVNVMVSTDGKGYPIHENEIYGVLYSTKLAH